MGKLFLASYFSLFFIVPGKINAQKAVFYADVNYKGGYTQYNSNVSDLTKNRRFTSNWNDVISSMAIPSGWSVTVYEHTNFRGRSRTFTGNIANLVAQGGGPNRGNWNDAISSIRINKPQQRSTTQQQSNQGNAWGYVAFQPWMNGAWRSNSGVVFTISSQSFFNGSNYYYIKSTQHQNGVYKIVTLNNNNYYTWFLKYGNNDMLYLNVNNNAFTSQNAAMSAGVGQLTPHYRNSSSPSSPQVSQPLAGQSNNNSSSSAAWAASSLPSDYYGRWRTEYQNISVTGNSIKWGAIDTKIYRTYHKDGVYKVITTNNGYYTVHFFQKKNNQLHYKYMTQLAFRDFNKAYYTAVPELGFRQRASRY